MIHLKDLVHLRCIGGTVLFYVPIIASDLGQGLGLEHKTRRFGRLQGRTQDIKKAYVRLAPGQTIDYEAKIKA